MLVTLPASLSPVMTDGQVQGETMQVGGASRAFETRRHTRTRPAPHGQAGPGSARSCLGAVPAIGPPPGACCFIIRRSPMSVDRATVATGAGKFEYWQPVAVQAMPIVHRLTGVKQFRERNRTPQYGFERFLRDLGRYRAAANENDLRMRGIQATKGPLPVCMRNRLPISFDIAFHVCLAWTCDTCPSMVAVQQPVSVITRETQAPSCPTRLRALLLLCRLAHVSRFPSLELGASCRNRKGSITVMSIRLKGPYPSPPDTRSRVAVLVVILLVFLMAAVEHWSLDAVAAVIIAVGLAAGVPAVVAAVSGARRAG